MIKNQDVNRQDEYFIPLDDNETLDIPESVSGEDTSQLINDPSLALKPVRFLAPALSGLAALLMILVIWQTVQLFQFLYASHWLLATLFSVILLALFSIVGKTVLDFFQYQKDFREVERLQWSAQSMLESRSTGKSKSWVSRLKILFKGKPQQNRLDQALASLPDYSDDSETIKHLDQHVFQSLDQQAMDRISKYSQQTALLVTLSPVAIVDMLFSVWRSLKMMDEICQIYGIRPSLPARTRLLKRVFSQMALSGAADLLSDQLAEFASNKLIGTVSAQAATGLCIGLYTARTGFLVIEHCRPVPFQQEQRPKLRLLAKHIVNTVKNYLQD